MEDILSEWAIYSPEADDTSVKSGLFVAGGRYVRWVQIFLCTWVIRHFSGDYFYISGLCSDLGGIILIG